MLRRAMRRSPLSFLLSAVFVCGVAACTQDANEACQVDRDCASGLMCNRALGSSRGECVAPGAGSGGFGGSGGSGGGTDEDAGGAPDAASVDAALVDAAGGDGAVDASASDADGG